MKVYAGAILLLPLVCAVLFSWIAGLDNPDLTEGRLFYNMAPLLLPAILAAVPGVILIYDGLASYDEE